MGDPAADDPRAVPELLAAVVGPEDDDDPAGRLAIRALHYRGSREALDGALALSAADDPKSRTRATDILGQLGIPERAWPEECFAALARLAREDRSPRVLHAACCALGHLGDPRAAPVLAALRGHPDEEIRRAVAWALGSYPFRSSAEAAAALMELTRDPADEVRDWATSGLGWPNAYDSPAIRDALVERLSDSCEDARHEAISALAYRSDPRALEPLIAGLKTEPSGCLVDAAAFWLGGVGEDGCPPAGYDGLGPGELVVRLRASRAG